jgi:hypothetical protein
MAVERTYPHLTEWVMTHGWVENGQDDYSRSFVRALDIGGMVWEGRETYATLGDALQAHQARFPVCQVSQAIADKYMGGRRKTRLGSESISRRQTRCHTYLLTTRLLAPSVPGW